MRRRFRSFGDKNVMTIWLFKEIYWYVRIIFLIFLKFPIAAKTPSYLKCCNLSILSKLVVLHISLANSGTILLLNTCLGVALNFMNISFEKA